MAREASLQVPSAKPVVCNKTSPSGEIAMMIRRMGSGPQFDGELDGAIGELGLGDQVALAARLQLGRFGGVGLQEAGEFLRFTPQALEVVVEDRTIGSDAKGGIANRAVARRCRWRSGQTSGPGHGLALAGPGAGRWRPGPFGI